MLETHWGKLVSVLTPGSLANPSYCCVALEDGSIIAVVNYGRLESGCERSCRVALLKENPQTWVFDFLED